MFERRLKIFLGILCAVTFALVLRAAQVQVVNRDQWVSAAAETMKRTELIDTVRGSILDHKGRVIAVDEACVDACVDYRALVEPPDEAWVTEKAAARLRARGDGAWQAASKAQRKAMAAEEAVRVRADIQRMWVKLAETGHRTAEQIADARQAIVQRVEMRRRLVWYRNYKRAVEKKESTQQESFWRRWLLDGGQADEAMDKFSVVVAEQVEPHVVLRAIDNDAQTELGKHIDEFPGLVLRPSTHRYYPRGPAACHLVGRVSKVNREDLEADPERDDEVRQYLPNDEIGRGGAEGLAERALRGTRGRIEKVVGEPGVHNRVEPVPGRDVRVTIDVELQAQIEDAFARAELITEVENKPVVEQAVLHGAAVVIDVRSGEVRALASYPTFDPNQFDERYADLYNDPVNQPLLNRATMSQLQPGSTVKPIVGLGAIAQGLCTHHDGIECTGFLVTNGRRQPVGRCWVASKFSEQLQGNVAHHPVPWDAPHPTGFLNLADALERSCNVYFETLADRMGMDGLGQWYDRFGLGRPTGIGIPEARGRAPRDYDGPAWDRKAKTWFAGIGQDPVSATPLQMANVAATLARGGTWLRPRLVSDAQAAEAGIAPPMVVNKKGDAPAAVPDRVDLRLPPDAVAAAKEGMYRVVHGKAGTGKALIKYTDKLAGITICGKTGTAQAGRFGIRLTDPRTRKPILDERGKPRFVFVEPSTRDRPNEMAPWYRGYGKDGKDLAHAWYIGFAPAENPQVAFAVMVEYGGSGGFAAGAVARKALEACVDHGYLR